MENMDPTEHKAISTSGTKVKHKPQSSVCLMDVLNMAQMLLKSWGIKKAGFYLSTGEEKGLGGPLSVLVDTAILWEEIKGYMKYLTMNIKEASSLWLPAMVNCVNWV